MHDKCKNHDTACQRYRDTEILQMRYRLNYMGAMLAAILSNISLTCPALKHFMMTELRCYLICTYVNSYMDCFRMIWPNQRLML